LDSRDEVPDRVNLHRIIENRREIVRRNVVVVDFGVVGGALVLVGVENVDIADLMDVKFEMG